jgi:hypothetical protein
MTTINDLIFDVKRVAYGGLPEKINLVTASANAGATTLSLELDIAGITEGTVLSSGLNVWYTKGTISTANQVLVVPGWDNSPQAGVAAGDIVYVRPNVTHWQIFNALNDEIRKLSSPAIGLYSLQYWEAEVDPTYQTYPVPASATIIDIARVRFRMPGTTDVWGDLPNSAYRYDKTNNLVQLLRMIPSGTDVQFVYKSPFTEASSVSDDVQTVCKLATTMNDIPVLGVVTSLLQTTEARRNVLQIQGDPRRAGEVQSQANAAAASMMRREYEGRIREEYARLVSQLPIFKGI